jgi:tetratricopeptide (TPR) repeat protein
MTALVASVLAVAAADDAVSAFENANKLYEEGHFAESAAAYEKLLAGGRASAAVYFNLGNSCFKSGQVGRAIVNYRLAEQLAPRDADIRANLRFARNNVESGKSGSTDRWRSWLDRLTLDEWTGLAAGAFWIWFGLLALGQWRVACARALRGYTATAGGIALGLVVCLGTSWCGRVLTQSAVVVKPETVVHYGPLEESPKFYVARDGTELTIVDRKGDWLQVTDGGSRTGWLRRDGVIILPVWSDARSSATSS